MLRNLKNSKILNFKLGTRLIIYTLAVFSLIYFYEKSSGLNKVIDYHFYNFITPITSMFSNELTVVPVKVYPKDLKDFSDTKSYISAGDIRRVFTTIKKQQPKEIHIIFPYDTLNYQSSAVRNALREVVSSKFSNYVGVLNLLESEVGFRSLSLEDQRKIVSATLRDKEDKQKVFQEIPVYQRLSTNYSPFFPILASINSAQEAAKVRLEEIKSNKFGLFSTDIDSDNPDRENLVYHVTVKYPDAKSLRAIEYNKISKDASLIEGKIVVVGFDFSKVKSLKGKKERSRERFYLATPWTKIKEADSVADRDFDSGDNIFYSTAHAIGLDNLVTNSFLTENFQFIGWCILITIVGLSGIVWIFPMERVFLYLVLIHGVNLSLHIYFIAQLSTQLSFSRTITYSALAAIIGAFFRSNKSTENRLAAELKTKSREELAKVHDKFLTVLSKGLRDKNKEISVRLTSLINSESSLNQDTLDLLTSAEFGAEELGEYLDGLEDCAKIENNALKKPSFSDIPLSALINSVSSQCHPSRKSIDIDIEVGLDETVLSDEIYLKAVIFNLISNAIKYSPEHSTVKISSETKSKNVHLHVMDNGPGIPDELREVIFEKFYRIKDDRAFTTKGSGIGLYLTRYFADIINCEVFVEQAYKNGAQFTLIIPR